MAAYKISYFNLMGRAELSRLLLSAAGKEFEDDRFEKEEWPARKPSKSLCNIKKNRRLDICKITNIKRVIQM